ncbi:MAG: helix-turn-helix transcriptional regulator [Chromatiaceae bacterium]|nr:helix-turn-helix transcriptional regulator [Chromatiaceae bacterium]MCP5314916.1 helix-turn-helix transcriptional regulator [Chromatiaceae bacterium]
MPPNATLSPQELGLLAAAHAKEAGLGQQSVAIGVGVNQSQVSRIFRGQVHRHTDVLMRVCRFVANRSLTVAPDEVRGNDTLIEAVAEVWDGTEQDAQALAAVIRSLRMLRRSSSQ